MNDLVLFEKLVRVSVSNIAVNRAPTEDELLNACNMVRMMQPNVSDEDVDKLVKKLQVALDVAMDVGIVIEKEYEPWLKGKKESINFFYWDRYVHYLEQDMMRTSGVIATIDEVSDKIIDLAGDPTTSGRLKRRGLLLGDIQSGKTGNYIAVMNKAADVGYKVIILLTGTIESLRRQTQERVDEGFIGRSSKAYLQKACSQTIKKGVGTKDASRFATGFTTESSDFKSAIVNSLNLSLHSITGEPVVFVLKKNATTLKNLIGWLEKYNTNGDNLIDFPLLLIDDEADNASINTKDDTDPTTINKHIRKLLNMFTKSSYMAVTATPFANIFILPEKSDDMETDDLFPADYIYALNPPTNYIGSNEIFGDDAIYKDCLIPIDDAQSYFPFKHKKDIEIDELPESLYSALRYFLLANVWRDLKDKKNSHRSMLVNVSRFNNVQDKIKKLIQEWLYEVKRDVKNYCKLPECEACKNDIIRSLKADWMNPQYPFLETGYQWEEIQQEHLLSAITNIDIITVNQRSASKLDYTEYSEEGLRVIALGGLSLSRGLTLEGLMVSYFHRNTQMYDTLMQMGRWFGYRDGYTKLFKIWMPDDSVGWYAHITQASNELREDIFRMNRLGATPKEFGLKVKAHPTSLIVTAKNKMKHAEKLECWITLDGKFFETPRFRNDISAIRVNKVETDKLIRKIVGDCGKPQRSGNQPFFWKDVPSHLISEYVSSYENHPLNMESDGQALENYIQKNSCFAKWDVLVVSGKSEDDIIIDGTDITIHPTVRPFVKSNNILSVYGTKMRIGTMGLTKHGLTSKEREEAENDFREYRHDDYVLKYGDEAETKLKGMTYPDRAYLVPGRNPILILHYLKPKPESDLPKGYDFEKDLMVGYGMGFPRLADSEPKYAVYYVNMVEYSKEFEDEIEEDQLYDIDD